MLFRSWDKARTRPLFVQAALYLSTEQTRSLAADALPQLGSDAFNYIDDFFGLRTSGLVDRLTIAHLESLRPHLLLLSNTTIAHMIEFCGRYGYLEWAGTYLLPECKRREEESAATGGGERASVIERVVRYWMPSKDDLFADRTSGTAHRHSPTASVRGATRTGRSPRYTL